MKNKFSILLKIKVEKKIFKIECSNKFANDFFDKLNLKEDFVKIGDIIINRKEVKYAIIKK
jgi:hypothetical protein